MYVCIYICVYVHVCVCVCVYLYIYIVCVLCVCVCVCVCVCKMLVGMQLMQGEVVTVLTLRIFSEVCGRFHFPIKFPY